MKTPVDSNGEINEVCEYLRQEQKKMTALSPSVAGIA
jgi:hypothetical protein